MVLEEILGGKEGRKEERRWTSVDQRTLRGSTPFSSREIKRLLPSFRSVLLFSQESPVAERFSWGEERGEGGTGGDPVGFEDEEEERAREKEHVWTATEVEKSRQKVRI